MRKTKCITVAFFALAISSLPVFAQESPEAAGGQQPGIFSGSMADSIWAIVAFIILLSVLGKLAWKPLLAALRAREDRIREEILSAENARRQAEKTLNDYNSRMEQLHQQARQISEEAARKAQNEAAKIAEMARQEALATKQKAQSDIEAAHDAAKQRLWEESGDIVLQLTGHILGRTISAQDNQRLINEAIEKLKTARNA